MPKKKTAIKILEFDKWLGNPNIFGQRGGYKEGDELDEAIQDAARMKIRKVKMLELDRYLFESQNELDKAKAGGIHDLGALPSSSDFMKMARLMVDLDPEEQKRVANAYTVLRMADKGQVGGSLQYLAPLLGFARQNPGASEDQMIKYLTLMDSQLMKGLEISKAMSPGQPEDSTLKILALMKDLIPVLQGFKGDQQRQGVFDTIFLQPDVYNRFKELGMFGGGSASKNMVDLEIEKLRGERQLNGQKIDLEYRKMMLENDNKQRRTEMIMSAFPQLAMLFAGPVDERMREMGRQSTANPRTARHTNVPQDPTGVTLEVNCEKCGYKAAQTLVDPLPETIACPQCSNIMNIVPQAPPGDVQNG